MQGWWFVYLVVGLAFLAVGLLYLYWLYIVSVKCYRYKNGERVPGPPPSFPLGNLSQMNPKEAHLAMENWRKKFGDVYQFWSGFRPVLFIHDLEAIKHISSSKSFIHRFQTPVHLTAFNNKGIIFSNDEEHHKVHRSVVLKGLMRTSYLKGVVEQIRGVTQHQLHLWHSHHQLSPFPIDAYQGISVVTLDVIGQAAFGVDLGGVNGQQTLYQQLLYRFLDGLVQFSRRPYITRFFFYKQWRQWLQDRDSLNEINLQLVRQRREQESAGASSFNDFLSILIDPQHHFTDQEISMDIQDLLAAGHETTSNSIAFALWLLAHNPAAQDQLHQEAQQFPSDLKYEDLNHLKIAEAVVKETLRLYPVIPFVLRRATQECQLEVQKEKEVKIVEGGSVIFSLYSLGADPFHWEDPHLFNIDRWLIPRSDNNNPTETGAWLPFGTGWRSCVGARMAMIEAKMILSMIVKQYHITAEGSVPLQLESVISLRPKNATLLLTKRL
jgi:cytochrome P450 family 3 subfamily A